ncbi:site-specific integrase [Actinomadura sp. ATCC 31491]|uniref:Site-specific integrase n=1 Tax=Actinomadura luzonensis TaxID=2805427 RepID=A0ABT0FQQ3_9ACTN|nr:site-specific integrase [Actinomadura luzonensis]MCK2214243.1 site-specific integrase [Actinomadura luzonensis]
MAYTEIRNGTIRVRYKLANGKYSGGVSENPDTGEPWASEDEAREWGRDEEVLIRRGIRQAAQEAELPPTFAEFAWAWYRGLRLQPTTMAKYRSLLENHLLHRFGERRMQIDDWPSEEFDGWEMDMIRVGYERSTAGAARNLLVNVLNASIPRYMHFNPAERRAGTGMKGLRRIEAAARGAKVWPSPLQALLVAERCALLAQHDDVFLQMVTKAWTGLRWSEVSALQPDKLLPADQLLNINQKLYELKGFYLNHPKDGSVRIIDVPPFLWSMLVDQTARARYCHCVPRGERELPRVDGDEAVEWCSARPYLFLSPDGSHFQRGNFGGSVIRPAADGFYPAKKGRYARPALPVLADAAVYGPRPARGRRQVLEGEQHWPGRPTLWKWPRAVAGEVFVPPVGRGTPDWSTWPESERPHLVTWLPLLPGLTPHGLRHGHQTWMDDGGIKKALKVERMGHEDSSIQGRYGHPTPAMRAELVELLQALWENAVAERFKIYPYSAIPLLDAQLAKWRKGTADKVISQISPRDRKRAAS